PSARTAASAARCGSTCRTAASSRSPRRSTTTSRSGTCASRAASAGASCSRRSRRPTPAAEPLRPLRDDPAKEGTFMLPRFVLLASLAMLLASPALADPADSVSTDVPALIGQIVTAYGGRAALEHIKAYRAEGRVDAIARHTEGPTLRLFQRPDR